MTAMCCCFGAEIADGNGEPALIGVDTATSSRKPTFPTTSSGIP
jgi:hypothetical protein